MLCFVCFVIFKGCCYYCHAGTEIATVSLASLRDLWPGIWARGPMVSQVSFLLMHIRIPEEAFKAWILKKSHSKCLERSVYSPFLLEYRSQSILCLLETSSVPLRKFCCAIPCINYCYPIIPGDIPQKLHVIRPDFFFQTLYNDYNKTVLLCFGYLSLCIGCMKQQRQKQSIWCSTEMNCNSDD